MYFQQRKNFLNNVENALQRITLYPECYIFCTGLCKNSVKYRTSDFIKRKILVLFYFGFKDNNNPSVSYNNNQCFNIYHTVLDKGLKWILDLIEKKVQTPDVLISMKNYFSRNPFPSIYT